jgi:hypothetical protein
MRLRRTRSPEAEQQSRVGSVLRNRLQRRAPHRAVEVEPVLAPLVEAWLPVKTPAYEDGPFSDLMRSNRIVTRRPRGDDYLHVSDLLKKCLRRQAIIQLHNMPSRGSSLTLTEELTFAQGDAIHDVLKARAVLAKPDEVWGRWRCGCRSLSIEEPCLRSEVPEEACHNCGEVPGIYEEVPMLNEELHLVGTPDVLLWKEAVRAFQITELKSMTHEEWKDLVRPKPDHVLQILFYWYLMRERGYPLTDSVSIFYATKSMVFRGRPYKEFVVEPEAQLSRLEPYIAEARALRLAQDGGPVPPRTKCASNATTDARQCEVCHVCFAMP